MKITPFQIAVDDMEIADLKRRLRETRFASALEGTGWQLGMDNAWLNRLRDYWLEGFDWRAMQSTLNEMPQFMAETDESRIHFARVKSSAPHATPIILTHGWPGTFAEFLPLARLLAGPAPDGGEAFDIVIPSLPGFGFSSPPKRPGMNVFAIADLWSDLMDGLGYARFLAHGGDIGAGVSTALALRHGEKLIGLHLNFIPGSYQPHLDGETPLSEEEKRFFEMRQAWVDLEGGYSHVQATKPDVLAAALNDSPMGLAAWIVDKFRSWSDCNGDVLTRFTRDELLTTASLYWFTRSMPSAIRIYWEGRQRPLKFAAGQRVNVPTAIARFPKELPVPPRSYVERGYNVVRWTEFVKGGHFAALEEPVALAKDIRAFAHSLRPDGSAT